MSKENKPKLMTEFNKNYLYNTTVPLTEEQYTGLWDMGFRPLMSGILGSSLRNPPSACRIAFQTDDGFFFNAHETNAKNTLEISYEDLVSILKNLDGRTVKPIEPEMRYFYIKYTASGEDNRLCSSGFARVVDHQHPNLMTIKKSVMCGNASIKNLVIDYIHEFKNKDDYDAFYEGMNDV